MADLVVWGEHQPDIRAMAVVGSYARGTFKPSSDLDLILIVDDVDARINDSSWHGQFGKVERHSSEQWGKVTSVRVWYKDFLEVEFGFAGVEWALEPTDSGTLSVIEQGFLPLLDKQNIFSHFSEINAT